MSSKRKVKLKNGTRVRSQPKQEISLANWDQGAMGPANRIGLVTEDRGDRDVNTGKVVNPNGVKGVRRQDRVRELIPRLTMRQHQAAQEIQNAYSCNDMLSSGSELKEQVDSSPKPDAAIAAQVAGQSRVGRAMRGVLVAHKALVHDICWHNRRWEQIEHRHGPLYLDRFRNAMDRAADFLGY